MLETFTNLNTLKLNFNLDEYQGEFLYWGYYNGQQWWRNYLHSHSFYEVCFVLDGQGDFLINDEIFKIKKGDLFIAKPNELHEIISSKENHLAIYYWAYTLIPFGKGSKTDLGMLLDRLENSSIYISTDNSYISEILHRLKKEAIGNQIAYQSIIKMLIKELIIETARTYTNKITFEPSKKTVSHEEVVVATIARYLKDNYTHSVSLEEISAQVYLSPRHISRLFKKVKGITIKSYAMEVRLNIAKQLLLEADISITNVAYETGFQDVRHFSTVFRKNIGKSPSEYRIQKGTIFS